MRAGERAALPSEQLALDQVRGQRRAVDDHHRPVAPRAALVNRARDQLFAGAGLPEEQHGRLRRGDLIDAEHHVAQRVAVADDQIAIFLLRLTHIVASELRNA